MNLVDHHDWSFPVPIAYGPGRLNEIAVFCSAAGMGNPLIVTDRGSRGLRFLADIQDYLTAGGLTSGLYADISPNPRDDEIAGGKATYHKGCHDGVIAVGGGSGMDGGKAIALSAHNDLDLWAFEFEQTAPDMSRFSAFPPLITVPTTAGTGAETESTAMITDTVRKMKWCIWHADLKPAVAILDPEVTIALPPHLTAWTGVDAMVHAIESYCVPGFNPLCDGLALEGLRLVSKWLPIAVAKPSNMEARGAMLAGSCLAGISFLKGLGVVHAISHMIGAEYDTQHGLTNAVVLPAALRHNAPAIDHKIAPMAQAMGLSDTSFEALYAQVCALLDSVDIPKTLTEIGVPSDCVAPIAAKALQDSAAGTNACALTTKDIETIITTALIHGR